MPLFSGWFAKKDAEDYEQVLSSLALDIQKRQTRLSEIRLRERRTTLLVTLYAFAFWAAYLTLWYTGFVPQFWHRDDSSAVERILKAAPVFVGPVVIQFSRRIVQTWYTRIGNAEEKTLKELYVKQRNKVEEIKKKTNYYSTRNLLERYDDSPSNSPLRRRNGGPQQQQQQPATPTVRPAQTNSQPSNPQTPASQNGPAHVPQTPNTPMQPPRKQWYDKVADALLGDDEPSAMTSANRYALICQKCFNHNGLVKESMWEDAQYVCPKCGHFNASRRSLRSKSASPGSPLSPLPSSSPLPTIVKSTHQFLPPSSPLAEPANLPSRTPSPAGAQPNADQSARMEVDS